MPRLIPVNDNTTNSLDSDTDALPGATFARSEILDAVNKLKSILDGYQNEVLYSSSNPAATEADLALQAQSNLFEGLQTFQATNAIVCRPSVNDAIQVPFSVHNGPSGTMKYRIQVDGGASGLFRIQKADVTTALLIRQNSAQLDLQSGRAFYGGQGLAFVAEIPGQFYVDQSFLTNAGVASLTFNTGFTNFVWGVSGLHRSDFTFSNVKWFGRGADGGDQAGYLGPNPFSLGTPARPAIPSTGQLSLNFLTDAVGNIGWNVTVWAREVI